MGAIAASNFILDPETPTIGIPGTILITITDSAEKIAKKATSFVEGFKLDIRNTCVIKVIAV